MIIDHDMINFLNVVNAAFNLDINIDYSKLNYDNIFEKAKYYHLSALVYSPIYKYGQQYIDSQKFEDFHNYVFNELSLYYNTILQIYNILDKISEKGYKIIDMALLQKHINQFAEVSEYKYISIAVEDYDFDNICKLLNDYKNKPLNDYYKGRKFYIDNFEIVLIKKSNVEKYIGRQLYTQELHNNLYTLSATDYLTILILDLIYKLATGLNSIKSLLYMRCIIERDSSKIDWEYFWNNAKRKGYEKLYLVVFKILKKYFLFNTDDFILNTDININNDIIDEFMKLLCNIDNENNKDIIKHKKDIILNSDDNINKISKKSFFKNILKRFQKHDTVTSSNIQAVKYDNINYDKRKELLLSLGLHI